MLLQDKVALISGVGSGMGREMALAFAAEGADLVLASRNAEFIDSVAAEVAALGRRAVAVPTDVNVAADRDHLVDVVGEEYGHLDVLVNNAAHPGDRKGFLDGDLVRWRKTMEVNLWVPLELTRACLSLMEGRDGRVIMINAGGSGLPAPKAPATDDSGPVRSTAYTLSKQALSAATRLLAAELAPLGVRVNGIHPGPIGGEHLWDAWKREAERRQVDEQQVAGEWAERTTLGYVTPAAEIARTAVYLASDMARPITGQGIGVQ
jgi:NAD(P)-dependent dehydrogenase (short-subunit alcohol dehydrogenase family)